MEFAIEEPDSVRRALELLSTSDDSVHVIAGGTGLTVLMRYGLFEPTTLVSLRKLPAALSEIRLAEDGSLVVGALATLRELEESPTVAAHAPLMTEALARLSNIRVRNVATLGGALAHGHPQMDLPPALLALDARVRAERLGSERWIPLTQLFLGYYETALARDELITEVVVPPNAGRSGTYRKVTARTWEDWPMLGLAVNCGRDDGHIRDVRIAVGALTDHAQRVEVAEQLLEGRRPDEPTLARAAGAAAASLEPHPDPQVSVAYQRELFRVHLLRALRDVTQPGPLRGPEE